MNMARMARALDQTKSERRVRASGAVQTGALHNYRTGAEDIDVGSDLRAQIARRNDVKVIVDLVRQWRASTINVSDFADWVADKHYRAIIAVGERAIPGVLAAIAEEPSWIVLALEELTGARPYDDDAFGDLERIVGGWLVWGSDKKLL
jgi:hypothetical protein